MRIWKQYDEKKGSPLGESEEGHASQKSISAVRVLFGPTLSFDDMICKIYVENPGISVMCPR